MRQAAASLAAPASGEGGRTSDLSIDEVLLLHSAGWEPLELVCGVSICSVPAGAWVWGTGEIVWASEAHNQAVALAASRLRQECAQAGGEGVVGVRAEVSVRPHHVDVELVGTAVRPLGAAGPATTRATTRATSRSGHHRTDGPWVSDLSGRDFALLRRAGWMPIDLVFGASFVSAPRRTLGTTLSQSTQNVELTNLTEAMYSARESAMERMQRAATAAGAAGVVGVTIAEGPLPFARHAVGFTARGTAVVLVSEEHQRLAPQVVLPLDDAIVSFQAAALRGD